MLKSFAKAEGSQNVSFWAEYFSAQSFDYLVRSFSSDPLRPLFERYCWSGARVLEGGCGLGNYLPCLRDLGARPIGLDFGVDLLMQVRLRDPLTPLTAGDVCALPFRDESLDVYYSGGVMEHFEMGPSSALAEAYRVLRPGGMLLVSVPFANPIRRVLAHRRLELHGLPTMEVEREGASVPPPGHSFLQYVYRADEFRRHLLDQGFEVLIERPYSLWRGLTDLRLFRWFDNLYAGRSRNGGQSDAPAFRPSAGRPPTTRRGQSRVKDCLKHWIFSEDRSVPFFGRVVSAGCEMAANMRLYGCRRP